MRVLSVDLSAAFDFGLRPSVMQPLGPLVVLAGRNGAGKSRTLGFVHQALTMRNRAVMEAIARTRPDATPRLQHMRSVVLDGPVKADAVLDLFPKSTGLTDHRQVSEDSQESAEKNLSKLAGLAALPKSSLPYVARVVRRWFAATHQGLPFTEDARGSAVANYARLSDLFAELVGEPLSVDLNQMPTLFGKPIADAKLSEGQRVLLQLAVALHAQGSALDGSILLLDEPEDHLHPAAIVQVLDKLRAANKSGQIWIATHSIPVLAAVPVDSIWFVDGGRVAWAGRNPEVVLESLLGGAERREQMEEFLRLPAQFASNRFAAECLVAPEPLATGSDDPQTEQIRAFILGSKADRGSSVRVLDFGAGRGRLVAALHERWGNAESFTGAIDYVAFEPFENTSTVLDDAVRAIYGDVGASRVIRRQDYLATLDAQSFDVIVMCNVLHEIPPEEWPKLFGADGSITRLLRPDGSLLLLEDMEMPHGEKAHRYGFLILDDPHLRVLMKATEADARKLHCAAVRDGRLTIHAVPRDLLGRTTRDSTVAALKLLRDTARATVVQLRGAGSGSKDGRRHALWTQLLANADLGIEALGG